MTEPHDGDSASESEADAADRLDAELRAGIVKLLGSERHAGDVLCANVHVLRTLAEAAVVQAGNLIAEASLQGARNLESAVAATYLGALLDDFRAADAAIATGYAQSALGTIAGVLDGAAMLEAYGMDSAAAEKARTYSKVTSAGAPTIGNLEKLADRVSASVSVDATLLKERLRRWYAVASVFKHKNPLQIQQRMIQHADRIVVRSGPMIGKRWQAHAEIMYSMGIAVVILTSVAFGERYCPQAAALADLLEVGREYLPIALAHDAEGEEADG